MSKRIIRDIILLLLGFGIIWVAFAYLPIFPKKTKLNFPIEKEEKLGKVIVEDVLSKDPGFKEMHNPTLDSAINIIESRLLDAVGYTDFTYKIMVVDNPTVNAFALPGGYIFVYTGLIEFTNEPEELAAVLAHEMGHIEERHVTNKLIKDLGISILTSGDAAVLGEVGRTAASTVFDRRYEREADAFALQTLYSAHISPRYMATLFRRMKEKEIGDYNENFEILMTHPHHNSRIKSALEYDMGEDFEAQKFDMDWERVKKSFAAEE